MADRTVRTLEEIIFELRGALNQLEKGNLVFVRARVVGSLINAELALVRELSTPVVAAGEEKGSCPF